MHVYTYLYKKSNAANREEKRHNWMFPELGKKTESEREREREISKRKIKRREEKGMENSKFCSLYLSTVLLFYIYLSIKSQSKRIFENQCFKFLLILVNNARMESCLGCTAAFASVFFSIL
jgi:hypothetical protein